MAAGNGSPTGGFERDRTKLLAALEVPVTHDLLERALTHRSYAYENGGLPTNERLEFLGDAVLGLIVTDTLYNKHPELPEGQLAKLRAAVVQMRALAGVARELRLGSYVRLGRGEEGTGGRDKPSILADTLEAVIGAVYLDRGLEAACRLVHRLFDPVIAISAQLGAGLDWKTSLQELTAAEFLGVPEYRVEESGPDHQKLFRATVRVGREVYGSGQGRSKKEAEQQAAEAAYNAISSRRGSAAAGVRNPKDPAAAEPAPPEPVPPEPVPPEPVPPEPVPPQDGQAASRACQEQPFPPQDGQAASRVREEQPVPPLGGEASGARREQPVPPQDGQAASGARREQPVPPQDGEAASGARREQPVSPPDGQAAPGARQDPPQD